MWPGPVTGRCVIAGREGRRRAPRGRGAACRSWWRTGRRGVLHGQSVAHNMTVSMLKELGALGVLVDRGKEERRVAELMGKLGVRPARPDIAINALSGGNQQKVLLGRCLFDGLKVLVLDEPTLGVDVGARTDIYRLVRSIARDLRVGVLMISSDVDEVLTEVRPHPRHVQVPHPRVVPSGRNGPGSAVGCNRSCEPIMSQQEITTTGPASAARRPLVLRLDLGAYGGPARLSADYDPVLSSGLRRHLRYAHERGAADPPDGGRRGRRGGRGHPHHHGRNRPVHRQRGVPIGPRRRLVPGGRLGVAPSVLAAVAMGAAIGLVQGLVITRLAVPAFVLRLAACFFGGASGWPGRTPRPSARSARSTRR